LEDGVSEFDDLEKKARAYAQEHPQQADKGINEVAGLVERDTDHQHDDWPAITANPPPALFRGHARFPPSGAGCGGARLAALVFLDRPHVPVGVFEEAVA
jgi:hypothetical protein